jgi:hypothetical protein
MLGTKRGQSSTVRVELSHIVSSACIKNHPTSPASLHYFTYLELLGRHSNLAAATSCAKHVLGYHTQDPSLLVTNCYNLPADTAAPYARQHATNNTRPPQLPQVTRHSYHYPLSLPLSTTYPTSPRGRPPPPLPLYNTVTVVRPIDRAYRYLHTHPLERPRYIGSTLTQ